MSRLTLIGYDTVSGQWKLYQQNDTITFLNTIESAECAMLGNATATLIATVSVPIKIAGITTAGMLNNFTHSNNRLTYTGTDSIDVQVLFGASFVAASNSTKVWRFSIAKNGVVLTGSYRKISSTTNNLLINATCMDIVNMATNDYLECWVQNDTDATDLTVDTLTFIIY